MTKADVNKEYPKLNMEREISNSDGRWLVGMLEKAMPTRFMLLKLVWLYLCSFWVKGGCKRGVSTHTHHMTPSLIRILKIRNTEAIIL